MNALIAWISQNENGSWRCFNSKTEPMDVKVLAVVYPDAK